MEQMLSVTSGNSAFSVNCYRPTKEGKEYRELALITGFSVKDQVLTQKISKSPKNVSLMIQA